MTRTLPDPETRLWRVTLRHDRGRVTLALNAAKSDKAVKRALDIEGAPWSAFVSVYAVDPVPPVAATYGAPMGRQSERLQFDTPGRWRATRLRLVDNAYDTGGAYWGARPPGQHLYAVQDGDGNTAFVDARSAKEAKATLLKD
jgi:hypothetical protein